MESKATFLGHPIHQMLIPLPLGLLAMGLVFDVLNLIFDAENLSRAAYYMIAAGIISGLIAAVFGIIDWSGIPNGTRAKRVGLFHAFSNVTALTLFAAGWFLRYEPHDPGTLAILFEAAGAGMAMVGGWLGGELINRLGVGVYPDANLDAPSSLGGN